MKKLLAVLMAVLVMPMAFAVSIGTGITPNIEVEEFAPLVWMCDSRVVYDDATEPGRVSDDGQILVERINNYAFEGEQITWTVLVMDKNKVDQNLDVYATVGDVQGEGNDIEVNCVRTGCEQRLMPFCNARILEEEIIVCDDDLMDMFTCTLTVETGDSMYGEYWITVEAQDAEGNMGTMDENEYWFLNPGIALTIDGEMNFENVRPGSASYSDTMLIGNDADDGSGVMMDMFISGTDFYDSSSAGTRCLNPANGVMSNQLVLGDGDSRCEATDPFCYFATNGAYSTGMERIMFAGPAYRADAEGYVGINYGIGFNNPTPFYEGALPGATGMEIIQANQVGPYYVANVLAPGSEMALTFRLNLPEPCVGNFDTGAIYFWGEAI